MESIKRGTKIHHYIIEEQIGEGASGAVYKAQVENLGRKVALKILLPHLTDDQDGITRFKREASGSSQLNHPNIVAVYDFGKFGDIYYLTMPLIEGGSLADQLMGRPFPFERAVEVILQICQGLSAAHEAGIVHRDIKPENILFHRGRVAITDFGLSFHEDDPSITVAGSMIGTPMYMSPEQAKGLQADLRSDIYALGVVLYEMLIGKPPFPEDLNCPELMSRIIRGKMLPLPQNSPLPKDLEYIIKKCINIRKIMRYQSVPELIDDLQDFQEAIPLVKKTSGPEKRSVSRRLTIHRKRPKSDFPLPLVLISTFGGILLGLVIFFLVTSKAQKTAKRISKKKKFSLPLANQTNIKTNIPNPFVLPPTPHNPNPQIKKPPSTIPKPPLVKEDPPYPKYPPPPIQKARWTPVFGGRWKIQKGTPNEIQNEIIEGSGRGTGEFSMASLRYGTKSYQYFQLTVKIQMLSGKPGMYAGVFITESDDYNKGFIYFVDDPSVLQRYAAKAPKIYKKMVKKYGKDLKFLRFALYIKGKWHPLSEVPIAFKRGQYVELKVEHFNGFLSTWINNRPVYRMRTRPFMGRVGLVKYYDAHVRYKDFKIRELKAP